MHRTAVALQARGHQVAWVSEATAAAHLKRWHLTLIPVPTTGWWWPPPPLPAHLPPEARRRERERRAVAVWLDPARVLPAAEAFLDVFRDWQPDVVVAEPFMAAAALAAERLGVPLVVAGWPAVTFSPEVPAHQREAARLAQTWFRRLREQMGVPGRYWVEGPRPWLRSPYLHVAYFTREWYGAWRILEPPTVFVGGTPAPPQDPPPDWWQALDPARPLVFVTLGTAFTRDPLFFRRVIRAARRLGAQVVAATGDVALVRRLSDVADDHTFIVPWVAYDWLFPRVQVAVHHGGVGTTHAALVYGVPQLVVPHAADQFYQAARVQRTGVGLALRVQDATEAVMQDALESLLEDRHWRVHAERMAQAMQALGGPLRAAQEVERLLSHLQ